MTCPHRPRWPNGHMVESLSLSLFQNPCTPGHVLQSARVLAAPGLFTTAPAGHTRLICCEMPPQPVQGDESKQVIVVDEHKDAAGKASTNPYVQCIYCDKE